MPADSQVDVHPNRGFLARAHKFAFWLTGFYVAVIALLSVPYIQRHVAYEHWITEPWHRTFDVPEMYGLAPGKTLDLKVHTSDNVTLGAWFMLADSYYQTLRTSTPEPLSQPSLETVEDAIKSRPTILYFHGSAGSRCTTWRIQHYIAWTARLGANIFAIDYRGFGNSQGSPYEEGIKLDSYAAWDWLVEHGAKPEEVLVLGHSLGTGVTGKLASRLAREGVKPRGVVLLAPFSSMSTLLETYELWGFPLLQPLQSFALGRKIVKRLASELYDTLSVIHEFNVPTLIAHSTDDYQIPHSHSRSLMDKLLDPLLPPDFPLPDNPGAPVPHEHFQAFTEAQKARREARTALVRKVDVPAFGTIEQFEGTYGTVVYVEANWGSHSKVGLQEGVQDVIASMFKLGVHA
ncbi:Alpha/Beta hydrolase protein [Rhodofomes roseus]|uniref:Alpha/Beta hydrolase protein n=1 Tax=Rhodofomes roseus TaxID=34475 RepID=A0ABQ8K038_9APHY|nr:Alpha/Beta hydrolase protein [Rhodofomes roseus]KAH9829700.1 Alpha/Beta hydrolase protein [Rhodofomes roseus]